MLNGQSIILVVLGIVACFTGYSLFRGMLPLWGFILGGWLAMSIAPALITYPPEQDLLFKIGAFVIGGIIGAAIAIPLYFVIIFLTGAALGALAGVIIGAVIDIGGVGSFSAIDKLTAISFPPIPQSPVQFLLMILFGAVLGVMALYFQKFMITASSAFFGAAAVVAGLSGVIISGFQTQGVGILLILAWLVVGLIGMFVQYQIIGDEV